jgi:hypothetical protein
VGRGLPLWARFGRGLGTQTRLVPEPGSPASQVPFEAAFSGGLPREPGTNGAIPRKQAPAFPNSCGGGPVGLAPRSAPPRTCGAGRAGRPRVPLNAALRGRHLVVVEAVGDRAQRATAVALAVDAAHEPPARAPRRRRARRGLGSRGAGWARNSLAITDDARAGARAPRRGARLKGRSRDGTVVPGGVPSRRSFHAPDDVEVPHGLITYVQNVRLPAERWDRRSLRSVVNRGDSDSAARRDDGVCDRLDQPGVGRSRSTTAGADTRQCVGVDRGEVATGRQDSNLQPPVLESQPSGSPWFECVS